MANQKTEAALLKKVWDIANVLSSAGVGFTDYITQLTYILFLKMDNEKEELGLGSSIPNGCKWADLIVFSGEDLVTKYEEILDELSKVDGLIGTIFTKATNKIYRPVMLKKVIDMVSEENWYMMEGDFKGTVYEGILEKNGQDSKSGAGQYFTPRALISAIVDVINPKIGETIADPCCGTAGFLLAAYEHMRVQSKDIEKQRFLKNNSLYGADNTALVVTLASMNLYLHDIGINESPITYKDSLVETTDDMYQVVMTNPPFGTRPQGSIEVSANRPEFIKSSNNQVNFLQHIMSIVKTGGRVGVVLPDSILTDGDDVKKVREKLLNEYNLHTILRLPKGIFYAKSVDTNVLFFDKGEPTKDIWVYDYRTGVKHTMVSKPMKRAHLQEFVDCYCSGHFNDRKETFDANTNPNGRWRRFSADEVKAQGDLNFKWIDFSKEDSRNIDEIYKEVKATTAQLTQSIEAMEDVLNSDYVGKTSSNEIIIPSINGFMENVQQHVKSLKDKIMEAAIKGSLTVQLPEDGTGEELHSLLLSEKENLIREGKISCEEELPDIKKEDVPFEIPSSWKWVYLDDVVSKTIKRGKSPQYAETGDVLVFAQKCNTKQGDINYDLAKYLKNEVICKYPQEEFLVEGDIVINSTGTGTLGRVGFIRDKSSCRVVPDSHVTTIRVGNNMSALFLYVYLKYIQATIEEMGTGTTNQKELSPQKIRSILIPLPPLKEQLRITNKLKVLLSALS